MDGLLDRVQVNNAVSLEFQLSPHLQTPAVMPDRMK